ncbi:hypothetical protein OAW26_02500 [Luminiphilus sp.]|nr:hypothetical protein [Luminiphilus sp.]
MTTLSKSQYIKYDKTEGLWIQHRKVVFLYWFKFLQHAERDQRFTVDWKRYKSWGGRDVVMNTKFDDWWKEYWKTNFGFTKGNPEEAPFFTHKNPEVIAMRTALLIYENRHRGDKWSVGCWVAKREHKKGRTLPKALQGGEVGFYALRDEEEKVEERPTQDIWIIDDLMTHITNRGQETTGIGKSGRLLKNARIRTGRQREGDNKDLVGLYENKESWVTLDSNDDRTRKMYLAYEQTAAELTELRKIKKRVQGYISRYYKQADELMFNISQGSLDSPND